jgi:hypothetical protein
MRQGAEPTQAPASSRRRRGGPSPE